MRFGSSSHRRSLWALVDTDFNRAKAETKRKLEISRASLTAIDDELRQTFQDIEKV